MNQWWRSWHGAPTDPKWIAIAQRTQTNAGTVSAVAWALFDHASQQEDRGDISTFDAESYGAYSGFGRDLVEAIIQAMSDKKLIQSNRLTAWEKRQPRREDGSAERAKEWRERKRTQANAKEHRLEETREDKNKKEDSSLRSLAGGDVRRETSKRSRQTKLPLPEDWQPNDMHRVAAARLKLPPGSLEGRAEDMRIWAGSNDVRKANWDLTFHGFLRKAANETGQKNGYGGSRTFQDDSRSLTRAADNLIEKAERGEFSFGPRPSLLPTGGEDVVRLLPKGRSA